MAEKPLQDLLDPAKRTEMIHLTAVIEKYNGNMKVRETCSVSIQLGYSFSLAFNFVFVV